MTIESAPHPLNHAVFIAFPPIFMGCHAILCYLSLRYVKNHTQIRLILLQGVVSTGITFRSHNTSHFDLDNAQVHI